MAACIKRIMEPTKGLGHSNRKCATKGCFIFESWFSLKRSSEAMMDVSYEIIGMVKTNTKDFCEDTIKMLTKDW